MIAAFEEFPRPWYRRLVGWSANTTGGATQILHTTQHHPFWNETTQTWTDAARLQPGHQLRSPTGQTVRITKTHNFTRTTQMHDLTIANTHTYYVVAGNTPVLVHNCGKNQGVYEFQDQLNPGKTYVGKTNNFDRRLQDHIDSGRLRSRSDATCTHVCGTDDDLFVAEHLRMAELRKQWVPLSNEKASPGKKIYEQRQYEQLKLW